MKACLGGGRFIDLIYCEVNLMQILFILVAHLFGDFVLQNDWMAKNKKKSSFVCMVHVAFYSLPFLFCGLLWWQIVLIALQHFAQDRSKFILWFLNATGKRDFAKPPMAPWSIIVVDNTFHLGWITLVLAMAI